jgi:hypothetical protein
MVTGRVVPQESRPSNLDSNARRQPRPPVVAGALAMSVGMIGQHRPSLSRGSALHDDADGLLTPRSSALTPPSQAGRPSGVVGSELPGYSGEDRVGLAPTSRFCITAASVAADHQAMQRTSSTTPNTSASRRVASAAPTTDVSNRREPRQRPAARSVAPVRSSQRTRNDADAGHGTASDPASPRRLPVDNRMGTEQDMAKIVAAVLEAETGQLQTVSMDGDVTGAAGFRACLPRPARAARAHGHGIPTGACTGRAWRGRWGAGARQDHPRAAAISVWGLTRPVACGASRVWTQAVRRTVQRTKESRHGASGLRQPRRVVTAGPRMVCDAPHQWAQRHPPLPLMRPPARYGVRASAGGRGRRRRRGQIGCRRCAAVRGSLRSGCARAGSSARR